MNDRILLLLRDKIKEIAAEAVSVGSKEIRIKNKQRIKTGYYDWNKKPIWQNPDPGSLEFWGLRCHRIYDLRRASRAANLAYAFLSGVPYSSVERKRKPERELEFQTFIVNEVKRLVDNFGGMGHSEKVDAWLTNGSAVICLSRA